LAADEAIAHGLRLIADGADMLDIGGESTRPGADPVPLEEEKSRVLPVIEGIRCQSDVIISIDTMKPEIATGAMKLGANIWNDVSALRGDNTSLETAAKLDCQLVLMHMQGAPKTMQENPVYGNVVTEVIEFLQARIVAAIAVGIDKSKVFIDPGIGFGKTDHDNFLLLANLEKLRKETGCKVWLGASRKRFITNVDSSAREDQRLGGSLAALAAAFVQNTDAVRVHDVRQSVQMLDVLSAIKAARA